MPIERVPVSLVAISESEPVVFATGNLALRKTRPEYYLWIHPTTGQAKRWNPETEGWDEIPPESHAASHEADGSDPVTRLANVHLTGHVYTNGGTQHPGITENVNLATGTLSIKNGIIIGWEPQ